MLLSKSVFKYSFRAFIYSKRHPRKLHTEKSLEGTAWKMQIQWAIEDLLLQLGTIFWEYRPFPCLMSEIPLLNCLKITILNICCRNVKIVRVLHMTFSLISTIHLFSKDVICQTISDS